MSLIISPLAAIVVAMAIGIGALAAFFLGFATTLVTSISALIAFLLVLI